MISAQLRKYGYFILGKHCSNVKYRTYTEMKEIFFLVYSELNSGEKRSAIKTLIGF